MEKTVSKKHEHNARREDRSAVFITGATGAIGTELTRLLAASGRPTRTLFRREEQAEKLRRQGLEPVFGNFDDPASIEAAAKGCDTMFLLSPGAPNQAEREYGAIDAAKRAGVRHVVRLSAADANLSAPVPWARAHAEIDAYLRSSGLAWTVLKPTAFMQNFLTMIRPISKGLLPHIAREGRVGYIDARDIAAVAGSVLADAERHEGATYFLTGPEAITMREGAARLSGAMGRRVRYVNVPTVAFRLALKLAGVDDWLARGLIPQFSDVVAGGHGVDVTCEVTRLAGRAPHSFADFARDHQAAFSGETHR